MAIDRLFVFIALMAFGCSSNDVIPKQETLTSSPEAVPMPSVDVART